MLWGQVCQGFAFSPRCDPQPWVVILTSRCGSSEVSVENWKCFLSLLTWRDLNFKLCLSPRQIVMNVCLALWLPAGTAFCWVPGLSASHLHSSRILGEFLHRFRGSPFCGFLFSRISLNIQPLQSPRLAPLTSQPNEIASCFCFMPPNAKRLRIPWGEEGNQINMDLTCLYIVI